jgi:hypothetical protein
MLVPHDNERVRSFQVAWKDVRAVVSAILLVVFLLGTFTVAFFVKQSQHVRAGSLRRENELLAAEVTQMRAEMEHLNQSIETLGQKDEQYRVMSGLNALTSDPRTGTTRSVSEQALMHLNPEVGGRISDASTTLDALTRRASRLRGSMDQALTALQRNRDRLASTPTIAPARGPLSSLFSLGRYHPCSTSPARTRGSTSPRGWASRSWPRRAASCASRGTGGTATATWWRSTTATAT